MDRTHPVSTFGPVLQGYACMGTPGSRDIYTPFPGCNDQRLFRRASLQLKTIFGNIEQVNLTAKNTGREKPLKSLVFVTGDHFSFIPETFFIYFKKSGITVYLSHCHPVTGQCPCLIHTEDPHGTESLYGHQVSDDDLMPSHLLDPDGEGRSGYCRTYLWTDSH